MRFIDANKVVKKLEEKAVDMCFCDYNDAIIDAIEIVNQSDESEAETELNRTYLNAVSECLEIVKFHRNSWDGIEHAIRDIEELIKRGL